MSFFWALSMIESGQNRGRYQLLQQRLRGFVSVGHRPSLQDFHSHVLWLQRKTKTDPIEILFLEMNNFRSLEGKNQINNSHKNHIQQH